MKSTMPYAGLSAADMRRTAKAVFKANPITDKQAWCANVLDLWRHARVREERYAAIELLGYAKYAKVWRDSSIVPLLRELIETGAWWDYVDNLSINHVGPILAGEPEIMYPLLRKWSRDPHLWIRRTAILAQLKFKTATDTEFLAYAIEGSASDTDFFARKAIGWALREYSRTDPDWVTQFVQAREDTLSPLSKREALRLLAKL